MPKPCLTQTSKNFRADQYAHRSLSGTDAGSGQTAASEIWRTTSADQIPVVAGSNFRPIARSRYAIDWPQSKLPKEIKSSQPPAFFFSQLFASANAALIVSLVETADPLSA